jgi:F-type H+-transporting ATPase subunit b
MTPPNLSLFLIMICFWLTMWLVYRYLIVPLGQVVAERQGRIDDAQGEWETTHTEYLEATARLEQQIEEAVREAARVRATHRQAALDERQKTLDAARDSADRGLQQTLAELDADASAARTELGERARDLARLFASQLLEREVAS